MADYVLPSIQLRRHAKILYQPKFPIPLNCGPKIFLDEWTLCSAYICGEFVVLTDPGDIHLIHQMGCFGKGNLSRFDASYNEKIYGCDNLCSVPSRKYIRYCSWSALAMNGERIDDHIDLSLHTMPKQEKQGDAHVDKDKLVKCIVEEINRHPRLPEDAWDNSEVTEESFAFWGDSPVSKELVGRKCLLTAENDGSQNFCEARQNDKTSKWRTAEDWSAGNLEHLPQRKKRRRKYQSSNEPTDLAVGSNLSPPKCPVEKKMWGDWQADSTRENFESLSGDEDLKQEPDILVIADTEESDCESPDYENFATNRPYALTENLFLTYEEAFFLSYALGCLIVYNSEKKPLHLEHLWTYFVSARKDFLPLYIAFQSLRSRGWICKPGLQFGADFVLYADDPAVCHSSFCVHVRHVDEHLRPIGSSSRLSMSWAMLAGLNRVTEQTGKEFLVCYVVQPSTITREELNSPDCINKCSTVELVVSRWVPSENREESCR